MARQSCTSSPWASWQLTATMASVTAPCLCLPRFHDKRAQAYPPLPPTITGTRLLERTLAKAAEDPNIVEAYLHVQTSNEEAIHFYQNFGFTIAETVPEYYRKNRLQPPDAHILARKLQRAESLGCK